MAIVTQCSCGTVYNLKNEFAGSLLMCSQCSASLKSTPILPLFDNDKFMLRQKYFTIATKYSVRDLNGNEVLFVERPQRIITRVGLVILLWLALTISISAGPVAFIMIPFILVSYIFINPKRHITFYESASKEKRLLEIKQDNWLQKKWISYTVQDADGNPLGTFKKNRFTDFWRRKWRCYLPDGRLLFIASEDSLIAALLRRVTGYFIDIAVFRTNFVVCAGDSEEVVGEFNRKISILDRYILDMSFDVDHVVDKRIALALGVLLDTGEGR